MGRPFWGRPISFALWHCSDRICGMKGTLIVSLLLCAAASFAQERIELVSNVEAMDHLIYSRPARYQQNGAEIARITGVVNVLATVGQDGKVLETRTTSGHPLLADGALLAVRGWKFRPFERQGKPTK